MPNPSELERQEGSSPIQACVAWIDFSEMVDRIRRQAFELGFNKPIQWKQLYQDRSGEQVECDIPKFVEHK